MPPRRRIATDAGRAALAAWQADPAAADRTTTATAVRWALEELATRSPGRTVEVRVPPFGATQCIEGPVHTRGTPPNVVETNAATWLGLVAGTLAWSDALASGRLRTSGQRADLSAHLPLTGGGV